MGNTVSGIGSLTRQQRGSRCPYRGTHKGDSGSTEQDSVLGIKLGLRDIDICSRVYIQGGSESGSEYEV